MQTNFGRRSGERRFVWSTLVFAGIVIGVVAVSRATFPQEDQKPREVSTGLPGEAEVRNLLKAVTTAYNEVEVRNLLKEVTAAYNQADAKGLAALFTDNAALVDQDGEEVRGRDAIARRYDEGFGKGPACKIAGDVEVVRFPTPDVASVVGHCQLEDEDGAVLSSGRYGLIAIRQGDQWRVAELRDDASAANETSGKGDQLRQLEWLVGDWVDEDEDARVATNVRWGDNQSFLVRTYSVHIGGEPARSGTQWIGWDPQTKQIRSWVFDSDGGFGQGQWTHSGDAWLIKAGGVTGDGLTTSATQVIQPVNKDAVKFRSTDRIVGNEVLPDIVEVVMVRKPPAPDSLRHTQPSEVEPPEGATAPESEQTPSPNRP